MDRELQKLIDGYCDDMLSPDEVGRLNDLIKFDREAARQFAAAALLHDRLRAELLAVEAESCEELSITRTSLSSSADAEQIADITTARAMSGGVPTDRLTRRRFTVTTIVASMAICLIVLLLIKGGFDQPASAAVVELNRLIQANAEIMVRTYRIKVEGTATPSAKTGQPNRPEDRRPPKPPMDDALLHVRRGGQFVLVRRAANGQPFITGCNGRTSWAVRHDGPVRCSVDLDRFNHDVPGHEHAMPLINIKEGLERLRIAYDVQLLPIEKSDDQAEMRLLVAIRKPKERGPRRVEITYSVKSGLIQEMRFVDMPYGPDRLNLQMTLTEERDLGSTFFDHESHHDAEREVRFE